MINSLRNLPRFCIGTTLALDEFKAILQNLNPFRRQELFMNQAKIRRLATHTHEHIGSKNTMCRTF